MQEKNNKKEKKYIIAVICLFFSFLFLFAGVSYSIFSYFGNGMTNNVIQTGRIIFSYSDANGGTNGIQIQDALPISDEEGKILMKENEYFDFTVSASTTKTDLLYEIVVNKDPESTLSEEWLKVYLTTFEGNKEVATPLTKLVNGVTTYSELQDTDNDLLTGKTVCFGNVQAGEVAYGRKFRLRIWVKDPNQTNFDYTILNDKYFSLKVSVAAVGTY